jgi:hypothetical protein
MYVSSTKIVSLGLKLRTLCTSRLTEKMVWDLFVCSLQFNSEYFCQSSKKSWENSEDFSSFSG